MKWAITLSYFTFEARFWTNFGFDCCHLLGSCQSENFEVFFCYPFGFLLGRLLYFSFLIIMLTWKLLLGILCFWFFEPFICFDPFVLCYLLFFSCFVIHFCGVLCYSMQLDMPSCFRNGRPLWGFCFPRLEKTRSWPVIGFPAHVKYYKKKERRVWESFVILISSCWRLNNFIKFSLSSAGHLASFKS